MARVGWVLLAGAFGLAACGDDDESPDVAVDAGGSRDTGGAGDMGGPDPFDVGPRDTGVPATPLGAYCGPATAHAARCGEMLGRCWREQLTACGDTFDILRDEYLTARATCGFPTDCPSAETFAQRQCEFQATATLQPTALQTQLAQAFCTACPPTGFGAPPCLENFFFRAPPSNGGMTMVSGTGASFFPYSDDFVQQLLDGCVPAPATPMCGQAFLECVQSRVNSSRPAPVNAACIVTGPGD